MVGSRAQSMTDRASQPNWHMVRDDGGDRLVLAGDWIAQSGAIPEFAEAAVAGILRGRALQ